MKAMQLSSPFKTIHSSRAALVALQTQHTFLLALVLLVQLDGVPPESGGWEVKADEDEPMTNGASTRFENSCSWTAALTQPAPFRVEVGPKRLRTNMKQSDLDMQLLRMTGVRPSPLDRFEAAARKAAEFASAMMMASS